MAEYIVRIRDGTVQREQDGAMNEEQFIQCGEMKWYCKFTMHNPFYATVSAERIRCAERTTVRTDERASPRTICAR